MMPMSWPWGFHAPLGPLLEGEPSQHVMNRRFEVERNLLLQDGTRKARKNTVQIGAEATKRRWGFESLVRKPMAAQPGYSVGAALCVWPEQEGQETSMNHSIYGADRTTHLKVVVVALIAGILVAGFGILMHNSSDEGLTQAARVMKTGKPVMVTTSNKSVKS